MRLLTAQQMRDLETEAIESGQVTGLELMERAGRGVVAAIFEQWPELAATSHKAVVLCGPGNNGGDGFVVARLLQEWGWDVEVFLYGDASKLPPDARVNYERWRASGGVSTLTDDAIDGYAEENPGTAIAVDALFGTGLTRPFHDLGRVQDELNYWCSASETSDVPRVVAIDIPSGVCADSGRYLGFHQENPFDLAIMANLTVSFHSLKTGHMLAEGPAACGKTVVKSIGLEGIMPAPSGAVLNIAPMQREFRPLLGRINKHRAHSHKYSHGHALILSGPVGRSGAARLAARAALRVGAGLVTVAAPGSAMMECATQLTAIMLRKCNDADELGLLLEDKRLNALCLGPGLGVGERTRALVIKALADPERAVVLDADALTSFTATPDALFAHVHAKVVLTPHGGEFARLFPDIARQLDAPATQGPAYSKVDAARAAAARAGCVVLFKGPDTVIADPSGACAINAAVYDRAAPWLATAGSGDVLAGLITGLLARGVPAMQTAQIAAFLHVEAARAFGPGLIAEDLPEMLPEVLRGLDL